MFDPKGMFDPKAISGMFDPSALSGMFDPRTRFDRSF